MLTGSSKGRWWHRKGGDFCCQQQQGWNQRFQQHNDDDREREQEMQQAELECQDNDFRFFRKDCEALDGMICEKHLARIIRMTSCVKKSVLIRWNSRQKTNLYAIPQYRVPVDVDSAFKRSKSIFFGQSSTRNDVVNQSALRSRILTRNCVNHYETAI